MKNIKKICFTLLATLFVSNLFAQQFDFSTRRYFTTSQTTSVDLAATFDNGYALVGYSGDASSNYRIPFVLMADSLGQTIWQRHYIDYTNGSQFNRIIQLPDSSLVVVGNIKNQPQNAKGAAVFRLDKNGNEIWKKSIEFAGFDCVANDVIFCSDSSLLVAGSSGNGSFLFNLDLNGIEITKRKFHLFNNPSNLPLSISAIKEGPDNIIYFTGTHNNEGLLFALHSMDSVVFFKRYSNSDIISFSDLYIENDGIIIRDDASSCDLIKTDLNGNVVWAKNYTNEYDWYQGIRKMLRLQNGNFLIYSSDMATGSIVSIDNVGEPNLGVMAFGRVKSVKQSEDGGLFVLINGPGYGIKSLITREHFAVTKLDSLTSTNSNCFWNGGYNNSTMTLQIEDDSLIVNDSIQINDALMELYTATLSEDNSCVDVLGGTEEISKFKFNLVPNPAHDFLEIKFDTENLIKSNTLELLDLRGKSILNKKIDFNNTKIDISHLSNGVYIIRIGQVVERFIKD